MKKSELRQIIREEIKKLNEKDDYSWMILTRLSNADKAEKIIKKELPNLDYKRHGMEFKFRTEYDALQVKHILNRIIKMKTKVEKI